MPIEQHSSGVTVIRLKDDPIFSDDLSAAMELTPIQSMVLDFSDVSYLKSANLSALLTLRSRLKTRDKEVRLSAATDRVWGLFLATGLNQLFDFNKTAEEAVAALQQTM